MTRVLLDVDGVVLDLMGAFIDHLSDRYDIRIRREDITCNEISRSPALEGVDRRINLRKTLDEYLRQPNLYYRIPFIRGSVQAIDAMIKAGMEVGFVTAVAKNGRESYISKCEILDATFRGTPIFTAPSSKKWWVGGDYCVDDRWDVCENWREHGVTPLPFGQPWSEAPEGATLYDWALIRKTLNV